ncbi:TPA: hypothetical protein ACFNMI_001761 [Neisseria bacilliformis]|jgi:hypothetical protein|uniref:hypothetical protein n=1 Tax=Neisseria bacilliformis TaxID=267212 RepID=UPI0035FD303A
MDRKYQLRAEEKAAELFGLALALNRENFAVFIEMYNFTRPIIEVRVWKGGYQSEKRDNYHSMIEMDEYAATNIEMAIDKIEELSREILENHPAAAQEGAA